jgi:aspartyl-tRNA(Asn)/glutamyl-tRNA(Gln) amidotransferase subunit C
VKISEEQVRYVAGLANLELAQEEISRFSHELGDILTYVEKLNELDTTGVEPMAQVLHEGGAPVGWREDVPHQSLGTETALANAPLSGAGHYKVPKVIEK